MNRKMILGIFGGALLAISGTTMAAPGGVELDDDYDVARTWSGPENPYGVTTRQEDVAIQGADDYDVTEANSGSDNPYGVITDAEETRIFGQ